MINPETRYIGIIYALITSVFWGFLAIALKMAVNIINPYSIVWFRFFFAANEEPSNNNRDQGYFINLLHVG
jgi:hypothetical protein